MGHETMGIVEEVGPEVKQLRPGDRVVVAFDIACGRCFYCKKVCMWGEGVGRRVCASHGPCIRQEFASLSGCLISSNIKENHQCKDMSLSYTESNSYRYRVSDKMCLLGSRGKNLRAMQHPCIPPPPPPTVHVGALQCLRQDQPQQGAGGPLRPPHRGTLRYAFSVPVDPLSVMNMMSMLITLFLSIFSLLHEPGRHALWGL
jgi:hypothetical protein